MKKEELDPEFQVIKLKRCLKGFWSFGEGYPEENSKIQVHVLIGENKKIRKVAQMIFTKERYERYLSILNFCCWRYEPRKKTIKREDVEQGKI